MDAVNAFNQELFALMDMKPPISRAKMILITKAAIKAIKLYKHVVQIVEKFIKKCKPEYKVPGLYVIDSIVRQSRHQFGIDKDVFGPRFTKNLTATFQCLYLCPTEDKSKIVRVLNLWQKNGVFRIEIIQPLLDMAAGAAAELLADHFGNDEGSSPPPVMIPSEPLEPDVGNSDPGVSVPQLPSSDAFAAVAQLFQSTQGQQLQQILQTFQQPPKPQSPAIDENVLAQVQALTSQFKAPSHQSERKTTFDKLLDRFDYDDEPETADDSKKEGSSPATQPAFSFPVDGIQPAAYTQMPAQMANMEQFQMLGVPQEPLHHQAQLPPNGQMLGFGMIQSFTSMAPPVVTQESPQPYQTPFQMPQNEMHVQKEVQQEVTMEVEQRAVHDNKRHMSEQQMSTSSRSPKRRRSRSNSRSRKSRHRRSRSRSRDRRRHSPRSRSQERRDREKDKERRLKGLPPIKSEAVSVCSTTLWVGQLDKRTSQQDVANLLEEFGPIESINMIPPRGCAYIVMLHRLDAYRALHKLSRGNFKVNQKAIKIAWALNKGIKSDYKQYWDVEIGVTYIPWSKVKSEELQSFCEGGMLDNETLCPEWKGFNKKAESNDVSQNGAAAVTTHTEEISPASQPLPLLSIPIRAPLAGMPLQPLPANQPVTSLPPHQAMSMLQPNPTGTTVHHPGLPPPQGLTMPQGVPPLQGMPLPQVMHPPQGLPLPQGMPMPQGMPPHQSVPGMGALQPPFPGPMNIPPPGFAPGVPPPLFMRPGFNPMQLPPGFLPPPGLPPPMTSVSIPPPTAAMNIPTSTAGGPNDAPKDQTHGSAIQPVSGRDDIELEDNGTGFGSSPQGGPNNTSGPANLHIGSSQVGQHQGPLSGAQQGAPSGPQQGPPSGPQQGPPSSSQQGPLSVPHQGPSSASHQGPPSGPHQGPPPGPHHGPPSGPHQGPHSGPHQGPHSGPHQGPHSGPHQGPHSGPHQGPHPGPHQGPPSGPHHGPPGHHQGPPSGSHQGPPSHHHGPPAGPHQGHHGPGIGLQGPSTGLLGARPGLIPLQRPPGVPPPHMQRFPSPQRQMPPHMMHRGPPPGPGGYGMPPPHGMRGPFPPQGHFARPGGHGGPEDREGRQFRNDRQRFNPERERFGRRPFGNRNEEEREYFDDRVDEHDFERPGSRGRRSWGRGSPDHERHRDLEERPRWSVGREREHEPPREMMEMQEKEPHDTVMEFDAKPESLGNNVAIAEKVSEYEKVKEPPELKLAEETPAKTSEQTAKDSEPTTGSPP
ncbi:SR-related and CTD-associated factor 4 [Pelodytes ibericus]